MRDRAGFFLRPRHPLQRRYEALRAYVVEEASASEVARRFGYTRRSLEVLASRFGAEAAEYFRDVRGGRRDRPVVEPLREAILDLRRRNLSILDIARELTRQGRPVSFHTVWLVLQEAGVGRLPRRARADARGVPAPLALPRADAGKLNLPVGGMVACRAPLVFLFAPLLARLDLDGLARASGFPGSSSIPVASSLRSLLALKLLSRPRKNHVMGVAEDVGFGAFAGLNVLPKTTAVSSYSYRVGAVPIRRLLEGWVGAYGGVDAFPSGSFNLDFHTIRHHGDPDRSRLEKNYVPRRSQSVSSVLAVFAQEHRSRTLVWADANLVKREKADQAVAFVRYWERVTGERPHELVMDAQATTHAGLAELDRLGVTFLTLRERRPKEVRRLRALPEDAWTRVELDAPDRKWRTPRVVDERVQIQDYPKKIRQVAYVDLGREEPTLLITNDQKRGPAKLLERYAQRTLIENSLAEQVGFFHVDALSSDVRVKVDLDVVLSVVGSNCYHWLGRRLKGYESATAATLWRTFLDRPGSIRIEKDALVLRVRRFARAPVLLESDVARAATRIPWLGNRRIRLELL